MSPPQSNEVLRKFFPIRLKRRGTKPRKRLEKANTNSIYLLKEGLFSRAYEMSALLFVTHIQNYSV